MVTATEELNIDSIDYNVFMKVTEYLSTKDIISSRLVNSRWSQYSPVHRVKLRRTTVNFRSEEAVQEFIRVFTPYKTNGFPFTKFAFYCLSTTAIKTIEEFTTAFGMYIRKCKVDSTSPLYTNNADFDYEKHWETMLQNQHSQQIEQKLSFLLQKIPNLESLQIFSTFELGPSPSVDGKYSLPRLTKVRVSYSFANPELSEDGPSFLLELCQIPGVSIFGICFPLGENQHQLYTLNTRLPSAITTLYSTNGLNVKLQMYVTLTFYDTPMVHELLKIKSPPITQLSIILKNSKQFSRECPWKFQMAVKQWLSLHAQTIGELTIEGDSFNFHKSYFDIPILPALNELQVAGKRLAKFKQNQFPELQIVYLMDSAFTSFYFQHVVMEKVKDLTLVASEGKMQKSVVGNFPNVEELILDGYCVCNIPIAYEFKHLKKLYVVFPLDRQSAPDREWTLFSGVAAEMTLDEILTVTGTENGNPEEEVNLGLGKLKALQVLTIENCTVETLKAIVFLTRAQKLRRLKVVFLEVIPGEMEVPIRGLEAEIKLHVDVVDVKLIKEESGE